VAVVAVVVASFFTAESFWAVSALAADVFDAALFSVVSVEEAGALASDFLVDDDEDDVMEVGGVEDEGAAGTGADADG